MIRRLLIPLLGSGLLLAAGAGSALGKCEGANPPPDLCSAIVADLSVGGPIGTFQAGTATSISVVVSQGEQPFDAAGVALTFTSIAGGPAIREQALPTEDQGVWRADVTLPGSGAWMVAAAVVDRNGSAFDVGINTVQVAEAPKAPPAPPTTPTPPVSPTTPALPIAMLVAGLGAMALLANGIRDRARRRGVGVATTATAAGNEQA
jgi:hypothetical protein